MEKEACTEKINDLEQKLKLETLDLVQTNEQLKEQLQQSNTLRGKLMDTIKILE